MNADPTFAPTESTDNRQPRLVAVIDIGATSLRMQIAEISCEGKVRKIEAFSQAVSLGKDTFASGKIEKGTIEDCVHVLDIYRKKLDEYGISSSDQIRVIATSGVKDASNRMAFLDRIFIATGFDIELIDDAELHRITFLGVLPSITQHPDIFSGHSVVCEVGGGTTELIVLDRKDVAFSQTLRLGALRLRRVLDSIDVPVGRTVELMQAQILQSIGSLPRFIRETRPEAYIALGGDIRFAANEIKGDALGDDLVKLKIKRLEKFVENVNSMTPDAIASKYHFSLPDAESLGPGLMAHLMMARELNTQQFFVLNVSVRDGLVQEMARGWSWSDSIQRQIVRSAKQVGKKIQCRQESRQSCCRSRLPAIRSSETDSLYESTDARDPGNCGSGPRIRQIRFAEKLSQTQHVPGTQLRIFRYRVGGRESGCVGCPLSPSSCSAAESRCVFLAEPE